MFEMNHEQKYIVEEGVKWYYNKDPEPFQYTGPPGSGKSYVLNQIIKRLGLDPLTEVAAMSFIGSAALVMRMKGLLNAKTIHSWIYHIQPTNLLDKDGNVIMDTLLNVPIKTHKFIPIKSLDKDIKLIAIDEGYTVPMSVRKHLERFGIRMIVCGDPEQLPPIGEPPGFLVNGKIYRLTQVMRQLGRDDIVYLTHLIRQQIPLLNGYYGNSLVIDKKDLTDHMLMWADAIICAKNSTRDKINQRVRDILGYKSDLPQYGEKVVCRKNNWLEGFELNNGGQINLVNGLIGRVTSHPDVSSYDGKLFSMNFTPDLLPDVTFEGTRCNYRYMISDNKTRSIIKQNKYEPGNMFEYAHAITCHVSQGSQFHKVIYIDEPMRPDMKRALDIVGVSRADQQLIYVKY